MEDRDSIGHRQQRDLGPIWVLLRRLRRRLRWQAAATGAVHGAMAAAVLLFVSVSLFRARLLSPHGLRLAACGAGALVLALAAAHALRRIRLLDVAGRIDRSHGLHDRIGSALQFARQPAAPGPKELLCELAVKDAVRVVPTVVPARAAPWHPPRHLGRLAALLVLISVVALVRWPRHVTPPREVRVAEKPALRLYVEPELVAPEREEIARLLSEAARTGDEEMKEAAEELKRLLEQVERGELSRQEVFDRLSELEQRLMRGKEGALEELRQRLRKAGDELGRDKLARELGKALQKEDLDKARKELERLAAQARDKAMHRKDKESLAATMKRAAEPESQKDQWQARTAAEQQQKEEQQLREEERRLCKKLEENPKDEESERRLNKVKRELERLEREKQERAEAQRELERLQRDLQQAAEEMKRQLDKMTPEQRQALEQLAKDMGRMQDEIRKLQKNQGQGQGQGRGQTMVAIGSLKQVLRRVARTGQGQGVAQGQAGQGQNGQGQNGQGGQGDKGQGKNKSPMKDFLDRASGKGQGGDSDVLVESDGNGKGDQQVMILGEGNNPVLLPGLGQKGQGQGQQGQQGTTGDGIGKEHDENLLGDATKLDSRRRMTRVAGKEGAGPSRSETILGSAERGFATQQYRSVYSDYTSVSEEVMSKERVPPGYRFYVKRYFQLIKPRE